MGTKYLPFACLLSSLWACTTVQEGLIGDIRADVGPFAQETVNAMSAERVDLRPSELTYLRRFFDETTPEIVALHEDLQLIALFRVELVRYSVELVRITDMNESDAERVDALATSLNGQLRQQYIDTFDMSGEEFDGIIANIRSQKEFLDAIKATKPIIDYAAAYHDGILGRIETETLPAARDLLDRAIEERYRVYLAYYDVMEDRRDELLTGLRLIREYRLGRTDAIAELRAANVMLSPLAVPPESPSEAELDRAETYLIEELGKEGTVGQLLQVDLDSYLRTRAELEREVLEITNGVQIARLQFAAWQRAHEALGNGVRDPAKWLAVAAGVVGTSRVF